MARSQNPMNILWRWVIPIRDENARYQNPRLSLSPLARGTIGVSS